MDITKSSATAHASTAEKLAKLEERLRHELMDDDERQELGYRILRQRLDGRGYRVRLGPLGT